MLGLPPARVVAFLFINTFLVGLSEELMLRGILFQAFLTRFAIWPAIWLTSVLFGAVHILNGALTGEIVPALAQSVAAFFSGVLFMAIRLRTGSLLPAITLHAAWDFGTFLMGAAGAGQFLSIGGETTLLIPVLFVFPNFLYGLYLMRSISRDQPGLQR